ncbi:unnamed protein product [Darwinula stevensoni]|uniref:G-protein coupled receptors family 1 profile domain-containing protein n=1 Tax=Darwinula stevensoni TaxID=69355 RepID=A0A7R9ADX4_9CRUS|nr:unnamed protein product [Darwinula stevensoni]CAG0901116.1 unnamed protein product [Darwinula stevensoni]
MKKKFAGRATHGIIASVWAFSAFWTLPPLFGLWSRYGPEPFHTSCSVDWHDGSLSAIIYIVCLLLGRAACITFCYLLPIVLVVTLYTILLRHVMRYHPTVIGSGGMSVGEESVGSCGDCLHLKPMERHLLKSKIWGKTSKMRRKLELVLAFYEESIQNQRRLVPLSGTMQREDVDRKVTEMRFPVERSGGCEEVEGMRRELLWIVVLRGRRGSPAAAASLAILDVFRLNLLNRLVEASEWTHKEHQTK